MLRNRAYIAQIDVPEFGISRRGDFEPSSQSGSSSGCKEFSTVVTK